jgi:PII-like signaling protein
LHLPEQAMLLRVFWGKVAKYNGKLLYEQLVFKARKLNLAGDTAIRGVLGYLLHKTFPLQNQVQVDKPL